MSSGKPDIPRYTQAPRPPAGGRPPFAILLLGLLIVVGCTLSLVIAARARVSLTDEPRVQPIQDMAWQPKFGTQQANAFFADGRAMRSPVAGVVARGRAEEDDHYYRGFSVSTDAAGQETTTYLDGFPSQVKVTSELLARGEQRFNIYCAACHGKDGSGTGPVHRRAMELTLEHQANWTPPADLRSEMVRTRLEGHIYNTINVGIRSMPAHGPQIPVADRWAIVAYVRALQLAANAPPSAVPAGKLNP